MLISGTNHEHIKALTGLRFVAAIIVVVCHWRAADLLHFPRWLFDAVDGGTNSVALFFVLSGFILIYNYSNLSGRGNVIKYLVSRFARIWPVVVLSLALGSIGVIYAALHGTSEFSAAALGASLLAQLFMVTAWAPFAGIQVPWNGPAWSIACEAFFYCLFPMILTLLRRRSTRVILAIIGTAWLAQLGWVALLWKLEEGEPRLYWVIIRSPVTHLPEFILGVGAGLWFLRHGSLLTPNWRNALIASSLAGVVTFSLWRPVTPNHLFITPFFCVLIVALAARPKRAESVLGWRPIVLLGEASFSLYMIHVPLLRIYQVAGLESAAWGATTVGLTVILSVFVFRAYETPMRLAIRRRVGV